MRTTRSIGTGWLAFGLVGLATACGNVVTEPGGGGAGTGGDAGTGATTTTTIHTGGSTTTTTSTGGTEPCPESPAYSSNCAEVSYFDCGVSPTCNGSTATMSWHEHVYCPSSPEGEDIQQYSCTYECPEACDSSYSDWPQDGAEFVATICIPSGEGGAGGGVSGGGYGGAE
jgi:hypothetical protein